MVIFRRSIMRAILGRRTGGERFGITLLFVIPLIVICVVLFFMFKTDYTDGLNYELNKDGSGYVVVKYEGEDKVVEIPSTYKGKPVVAIGEEAFVFNSTLETLRIPSSVQTIESHAFVSCSKLLDVKLTGATTIKEYAFKYCPYITYLYLPKTLTEIEPFAFYGCSRVAYISLEEGNERYHVEGNCLIETDTKTLVLGGWISEIPTDGSVTTIGKGAFAANDMIQSIVIPDCITEIGESAFQDCLGATTITISGSVEKIDTLAFYGCSNVTSVIYKGTSAEWEKIEIGDKNINFRGIIRYFDSNEETE